jgi:hypothetical protein
LVYVRRGYSAEQTMSFYCWEFECPGDESRAALVKAIREDMQVSNSDTLRSQFERVYTLGVWGENSPVDGGGSGWGSSPDGAEGALKNLPAIAQKYHVDHIIDIGCGSLAWMLDALAEGCTVFLLKCFVC